METKNWNGLEVDASNFFTTWEYSENFKDLFSSIAAETTKATYLEGYNITPQEAKILRDKYAELNQKLVAGEIVLDTQDKADKILNELSEVLKQLNQK